MKVGPHLIEKDFVVLSPDKEASVEVNDSLLYQRLNQNYEDFEGHELISCHTFSQNWSSWEIHPKGDEIVVLLSGKIEFVLDFENEQRVVALESEGDYAIVPKNTWHTARTSTLTKMLFITPGEGTEHKKI